MDRRTLLARAGLTAAALFSSRLERAYAVRPRRSGPAPGRELAAEVVIIGGGVGGCAAALAACRAGRRVLLTEPTAWLGGQLTTQAVPPDEHRFIEQFGCTRSYRAFRTRVRDYYRRNYPLTEEARAREFLNPGNGVVSRLCHEPKVALAVLQELLAPYVSSGRLTLLIEHAPTGAEVQGDRVRSVRVLDQVSGNERVLTGSYFLDASELGDLLPLTGTEYTTGAEAKRETGEPHAKEEAEPLNMQAFSCCFAVDYLEGEAHVIERPKEYAFWRAYIPALDPPWPGPMLDFTYSSPRTLQPTTLPFDPQAQGSASAGGLWTYRRILDRDNFEPGTYESDVTVVNWPQIDYVEGALCAVSRAEARRHLEGAKQQSLSFLYWLQTEAPRPDGKTGWPGLRLRKDVVGTEDGLAKSPYIRESRRLKAVFTVLEQHVATDARLRATGASVDDVTAERFADSVGLGSYRIDLHPTCGKDNYLDVSSLPAQIPLGALIPQRVENLLAACKNLGTTHLTNGCYRLHPVEWNVGEAAGALAGFCLDRKTSPRAARASKDDLEAFQRLLEDQGVELDWPQFTPT